MKKTGFKLACHTKRPPCHAELVSASKDAPPQQQTLNQVQGDSVRVQGDRVRGFTLAEVLITLAIIGVVAALTIPTVIRNYQETQTVTAVKKAYSSMSQAFKMAEIENGAIDTWDWGNAWGEKNDKILDIISPYLKKIEKCNKTVGCFADKYKALGGIPFQYSSLGSSFAKARLADGMSIALMSYDNCTQTRTQSGEQTNICGYIYVDINGNKKPNTAGKDFFTFWITKNGIVPVGINAKFKTCCNAKDTTLDANGDCCAAWIIKNGNMDYLRHEVFW